MRETAGASSAAKLLAQMKQVVDPNGVLAPGRYEFGAAGPATAAVSSQNQES
jgi:hypothetical protein